MSHFIGVTTINASPLGADTRHACGRLQQTLSLRRHRVAGADTWVAYGDGASLVEAQVRDQTDVCVSVGHTTQHFSEVRDLGEALFSGAWHRIPDGQFALAYCSN